LEGYGKAGLENVRFEKFHPNRWWPERYRLSVIDGNKERDIVTFPLWWYEGADNLELEIVYAGFGTKAEFRGMDVSGKAVLIHMKRIMHFTPSFALTGALETAYEKGAAAGHCRGHQDRQPVRRAASGHFWGTGAGLRTKREASRHSFPCPCS